MTCRVSLMVILMAQVATPVYAVDESVATEPGADFIEFLGEWESTDGEWIDPNELAPEAAAPADTGQEPAPVEERGHD